MKKIKVCIPILIVVIIFNVALLSILNLNKNVAKAYALLSWDLVDKGKHMDWNGSTAYSSEWDSSVNVWNDEHYVIRKDTWRTVKDVTISDYTDPNTSVMASCSSSGSIKFNKSKFDNMTSGERQKTIMHEIGHGLGLDHSTSTSCIMCQGKRSQTTLNQDDINGFDWLYKYHY